MPRYRGHVRSRRQVRRAGVAVGLADKAQVRELADALFAIEEYWNGFPESAIDAAETMRLRARVALDNISLEVKQAALAKLGGGTTAEEDICGFCGKPGADKIPHPVRWPGEQSPGTELVHAECENAECERAHAALTDEQRRQFLGTL